MQNPGYATLYPYKSTRSVPPDVEEKSFGRTMWGQEFQEYRKHNKIILLIKNSGSRGGDGGRLCRPPSGRATSVGLAHRHGTVQRSGGSSRLRQLWAWRGDW